jgi:hypothetical protein
MLHIVNKNTSLSRAILIATVGLVSLPSLAQAPISAGGTAVIDLPSGAAETMRLEIQKGRFAEQSVERLSLMAQGIDFKQGALRQLTAELNNALFDTLPLDALKIVTGPFAFSPQELLGHRRFMLDKPVNASVQLRITEKNMNDFFSNPRLIEKLEKSIAKKTGNISLFKISNPSLTLLGKNRLRCQMNVSLAGAVSSPIEMIGLLGLKNQKLALQDVALTANGTSLPFDMASTFQSRFNEAIDFERIGKKTFQIQANKLTQSGKAFDVQGQVALTRLEFGGSQPSP